MNKLYIIWVYLILGKLIAQPYTGPIAIPSSGYGAIGPNTVDSITFTNPADPTDTSFVYFPQGTTVGVPTVFFMAGNGGISPVFYLPYIHFIVSKGFAVVFVPSPTSQPILTRIANMKNGFIHAREPIRSTLIQLLLVLPDTHSGEVHVSRFRMICSPISTGAQADVFSCQQPNGTPTP